MARQRNDRLDFLLQEAGWSRAQAASAFNDIVRKMGLDETAIIGRSHVSMWVGGTIPSGTSPVILSEALSRRLKRPVTPQDLGFQASDAPIPPVSEWSDDPLPTLNDLGRTDLDSHRRALLAKAVYSTAALTLPSESLWKAMARPETTPGASRRMVGRGDVATIRDLTSSFSRIDQRRGGGHGRRAMVQYLHDDVISLLGGTFAGDRVRAQMFTAASELTYLIGWMAFDNSEHGLAQRYFREALKLAARGDNAPLAGHILRAMAHQALDLGENREALRMSTASIEGQRYTAATPRERALLGVVHARSLAANRRSNEAAQALLRAEDDLRSAGDHIEEPDRTFFFGEASLAHETACALRTLGDHKGAITQFKMSVRRRGSAFRRTHTVTLGYLGSMQFAAGRHDEACRTWSTALDAMEEGVYSGRARQVVVDLRRQLSPYRKRKVPTINELDLRAARHLARVD